MFEDRSSVSERLRALVVKWRERAPNLRESGYYARNDRSDTLEACADELDALLSAEVPHAAFHDVPRDQDGPIRIAMEMRSAAHHDRTKDAGTRSALAGWADRLSEWFSRSAEDHASTGDGWWKQHFAECFSCQQRGICEEAEQRAEAETALPSPPTPAAPQEWQTVLDSFPPERHLVEMEREGLAKCISRGVLIATLRKARSATQSAPLTQENE